MYVDYAMNFSPLTAPKQNYFKFWHFQTPYPSRKFLNHALYFKIKQATEKYQKKVETTERIEDKKITGNRTWRIW